MNAVSTNVHTLPLSSQVVAAEARRAALVASDIVVEIGEVRILNGASLTLWPGEVHVLIGPNGAGKSTLANVITGHIRPISGTLELRGQPLHGPTWLRARRGLSRKFQVPRIFSRLSVEDHFRMLRVPIDEAGIFSPLLAGAERQQRGGLLSHGSRQWLELHMVLLQQPSVVVLDEPTAGMPRSERARLAEIIREHRHDRAYLIVEHDMDFVEAVADRVSFMHEGRVLISGSFAEIQAHPTVREIYLGYGERSAADVPLSAITS